MRPINVPQNEFLAELKTSFYKEGVMASTRYADLVQAALRRHAHVSPELEAVLRGELLRCYQTQQNKRPDAFAYRTQFVIFDLLRARMVRDVDPDADVGAYEAARRRTPISGVVMRKRKDMASAFGALRDAGVGAEPVPWTPHAFAGNSLNGEVRLHNTPLVRDGVVFPKEIGSSLPPGLLEIPDNRNLRVLDPCAAPGGKTLQLSDLLGERGVIHANELNRDRWEDLARTLSQYGADNVTTVSNLPAHRLGREYDESFDAIQLDAPCSGTGIGRKAPDTVLRAFNPESIGRNVQLQRKLLARMLGLLKPGGTLVYSTCSVMPDENEEQVRWLAETFARHVHVVDPRDTPAQTSHTEWKLDRALEDSLRVQDARGFNAKYPAARVWRHRYPGPPEDFFAAVFRKVG